MKDFIKTFFSSCLGTLFALGLLLGSATLLLIGLSALLIQEASQAEEHPQPSSNTILTLSFEGGLMETISDDPFEQIDLENLTLVRQRTLDTVLLGLQKGATDDRIDGLYLDLQGTPGTWSQMNEIREAIVKFRESGKWVVAYGQNMAPPFYHLASTANTIALDPVGHLPLEGMGMEMLFFGRLLKEWDIEARAIRARDNNFKSAIEPFTLEGLSKENRLQLKHLLDQRWQHFTLFAETSRGLARGSLDSFANNLQPAEPKAAKELNLVDELLYEDEVKQRLSDRVGGHGADCTCHFMEVDNYARSQDLLLSLDGKEQKKGIGLIVAEGAIMNDIGSGTGIISPSLLKSQLKEMEDDDRIEALVLRINSPGGSAQASEWLWRAIRNFSHSKPVVVSLGPMAASGGYYMASAANLIVTDPLTLTGSIGVFGLIPRLDQALKKHLDITVDRVHTHPNLAMSPLGPISDPNMAKIQTQVDEVYRLFLKRVSEGRNLDLEKVHNLARGRIWTGQDAVQEGLADHVGGLLKAVELARDLGDIKLNFHIYTNQPSDLFELITKNLEKRLGESKPKGKVKLLFTNKALNPLTIKDWIKSTSYQDLIFTVLPWCTIFP